jgi:hypothetical protein
MMTAQLVCGMCHRVNLPVLNCAGAKGMGMSYPRLLIGRDFSWPGVVVSAVIAWGGFRLDACLVTTGNMAWCRYHPEAVLQDYKIVKLPWGATTLLPDALPSLEKHACNRGGRSPVLLWPRPSAPMMPASLASRNLHPWRFIPGMIPTADSEPSDPRRRERAHPGETSP